MSSSSYELLIRDFIPKDIEVLTIGPDAPLDRAMALMMMEGVDQLPVVAVEKNKKAIKGYIGWQTIGESYALGKEPQKVRDCMTKKGLAVVYDSKPLLNVVSVIGKKGFIVVRNEQDEFCGVITRGDVVRYLNEMFKPFALIGQIDRHLRTIVGRMFPMAEIVKTVTARFPDRRVSSVDDLTLGDCLEIMRRRASRKLLEDHHIIQKRLCEKVERVRRLRNDLTHFRSTGQGLTREMADLKRLADYLKKLSEATEDRRGGQAPS